MAAAESRRLRRCLDSRGGKHCKAKDAKDCIEDEIRTQTYGVDRDDVQ